MGTVFSLDVRGGEPAVVRAALEEAVAGLHRVDEVFSTYRDDSQISRLARGELEAVRVAIQGRKGMEAAVIREALASSSQGADSVEQVIASTMARERPQYERFLSFLGTPVPSQFLAMLPYVVTILAVAGLVGVSRGPAAIGKPYTKE